jgi:methionyl-tRNA formyltransferase
MNILLVGGEAAGIQTLHAIARTEHRLVAVLASPSKSRFAGSDISAPAQKLGVSVWPAQLVKDPNFSTTLKAERVDLLLNVHSLFIICPEVLAAPKIGSFNLHPGPLPSYAGLNSPSWAIYRGEESHGVTVHWMVPKIDAGPIAYQTRIAIEEQDTGLSLALKCVRAGLPLIRALLHDANEGPHAIPQIAQDLKRRTYFGAPPPNHGRLCWAMAAHAIVNFVRAYDYRPFPSPWGAPLTKAGNREVGIVAVRRTGRSTDQRPGTIGQINEDGVEVACLDEWILVTGVIENGQHQEVGQVLGAVKRLEEH